MGSVNRRALQIAALLLVSTLGSRSDAAAVPSPAECTSRVNDTPASAAECIQEKSLWNHLKQFQIIADENPGPAGHPNRNTGTSGYRASVAYVARLMRDAGYKVTVQRYEWRHSDVRGLPQ